MQNFCYLIGDQKTKQAWVVDPAWAPQKIKQEAEQAGFKLTGMVITHAHYDHTNAIELLLHDLDIPVYAQAEEVTYSQSGVSIVGDLGSTVKTVRGGEKLKLGETEIEFLHTPGHTPGSQCLRVENQLITGDTLFIGGCGRSDLPGGDVHLLYKSLQKIAGLSADLEICPGHDYGQKPKRNLREELALNPYLQMKDEESFLETMSS